SDICPSGRQDQTIFRKGRNPFQIRTTHRAVLYMSSCVLKHLHFFLKQGYLKQRTGWRNDAVRAQKRGTVRQGRARVLREGKQGKEAG
ncbi:hypothetical protein IH388_001948, partial [Neisseria gonorrhoeae]